MTEFEEYEMIHKFLHPNDKLKNWINESNFTNIYKNDWESIMEIVDVIEKKNYDVQIGSGCLCRIIDIDLDRKPMMEIEVSASTKQKSVYIAILQFIEYYLGQ